MLFAISFSLDDKKGVVVNAEGKGAVIWQVTMSLDSYIAGPDDEMGWVFDHIDPSNPAGAEIPERLGAVIAGRRSFDVGRRHGMEVYDGSWSGAQFLMTHRPVDALPEGLHIRSGHVEDVVNEALLAASGRDVGIIGANVARQAIEAGAVDEIVIHIAPVLLGGGVRLHESMPNGANGEAPGGRALGLIETRRHHQIVTLHYRTAQES